LGTDGATMDLSLFGLEVIGGRGNPNVAVLVGNSNEPKALSHKMRYSHESSSNSVNTVLTLNNPSMKKINEFYPEAGDFLSSCETFKDDLFIDSAFTDILFQNDDINDSKFIHLVTNSGGDR
jgi:hypothetical protein